MKQTLVRITLVVLEACIALTAIVNGISPTLLYPLISLLLWRKMAWSRGLLMPVSYVLLR